MVVVSIMHAGVADTAETAETEGGGGGCGRMSPDLKSPGEPFEELSFAKGLSPRLQSPSQATRLTMR